MGSRLAAIGVAVVVVGAAVVLGLVYWRRPAESQPAGGIASMPSAAQTVLNSYFRREQRQARQLAAYSDTTTIRARLPGVKKSGELEVQRRFTAPRRLTFTGVRYAGDGFVKNDIILGYLSREAAHVQRGQDEQSAITPANYRFSYKGRQDLHGTPVMVFAVRPRQAGEAVFLGRIYLNASTGDLVRAEGRFVQSPSLFISTVRFVKDYGNFDGFDLPTHIHSESDSQMAGHVVMDIYHRGYQVTSAG